MSEVSIQGNNLVVSMQGMHKLWALKSELTIPLTHVRGATIDPGIWKDQPSTLEKRYGTNLHGVYMGGTFVQDGDRVFWDVRKPENAIVISLDDAEYARLVIDVDEPEKIVTKIESTLLGKN